MSEEYSESNSGFKTPNSGWNNGRGSGYPNKSSDSYRGWGNHRHSPGGGNYNNGPPSSSGNHGFQGNQRNFDPNFHTQNRKERRRSQSNEGRRSHSNSRDGSYDRNGSRDEKYSGGRNNSQDCKRDRSTSGERKNKQLMSPQSGDDSGYCAQYSPQQGYNRGGNRFGSPQKHNRGWQQGGYGSSDSQTPGRYQQRWDEDPDVFLSKTLSSILRHNAERFGFQLMKGGFLYVDEILRYVKKLNGFKIEDVKRVVESNDKKRFSLENEEGRLKIRANQGHSIEVEDLDLKPILSADEVPMVIHGTYYSSWEFIKNTGLNRMNRNHIHFAAGVPGENGVISGMRKTCEVMIHIDMEKALKAGLKFFRSANNVILSPGDENGIIYPCFFSGALDRMKNFRLDFDSTISSAKNVDAGCSFDPKPTENKKRKKKNKGKNKQEEDKEFKEVKDETEAKTESAMEKKTEKEAKEIEDGATTDDMSLPAAKKPHLSQPEKPETPKAEFSGKKEVEQEPTRNENRELAKEEVKSKNWSEPQEVTTVEDSISLVNRLCENPTDHISVCCVGENLGTESSKIRMIVISCHPESYVYHLKDENRGFVKDGLLEKLLLDKTITKVFHDIGPVSASLIHEYDILMDGIPIWDISILFGKVCPSQMDMDELGYSKGLFKKWTKQNEDYGKAVSSSYDLDIVSMLYERGKLISDLYRACIKKADEIVKKKVKKEVFQAAIPSVENNENFLAEKVKQIKLEMKEKKQAEKPQAAAPQQSQQQQKQQGKSGKGKHGKGRKK